MFFRVGDMRAHCPACTHEEFEFVDSASGERAAVFVCKGCGRQTSYGALLDQITAQTIRRAGELLSNLRGLRKDS